MDCAYMGACTFDRHVCEIKMVFQRYCSIFRIHYYYLFGLLFSVWIGWNAWWAFISGETVNEKLAHLCDWAFSPKEVTVGKNVLCGSRSSLLTGSSSAAE